MSRSENYAFFFFHHSLEKRREFNKYFIALYGFKYGELSKIKFLKIGPVLFKILGLRVLLTHSLPRMSTNVKTHDADRDKPYCND